MKYLIFVLLSGAAIIAALLYEFMRSNPPQVRVAAAADLKFALPEVVAAFQEAQPDIRVAVSYGASGELFAQLSNGGPFDVFLSADMDYPRRLVADGVAAQDSEFLYAIGHLVLWVPRTLPVDVERRGVEALLDSTVK